MHVPVITTPVGAPSPLAGSRRFALAALATLGSLAACKGGSGDATNAGQAIYSPPGAVASTLIEFGDPKPLRTYGPDNHTWPEIRASLGHTVHRGSDKVLCRDCHAKDGFKHEGNGGCGREGCHTVEGKHPHGALDTSASSTCATCHPFHPGLVQKRCLECHKDVQTKRSPLGTTAANAVTLAAIVDGHVKADCGKCHQTHKEPLSTKADCTSCHEQRAVAHEKHKDSKGCNDCHAPHATAKVAVDTCGATGCHADKSTKVKGHASCLSCHKAHSTEKPGHCADCHKNKNTLAAATVPKHADCASCHTPHGLGAASATCAKCHTKVVVAHAKAEAAGGTATTPASFATKGETSVNACGACHAAHPAAGAAKVVCVSCHSSIGKSEKGAHAKTLTCASCHTGHTLTAPAKAAVPALCAGCHAPQAKLATSNKGHADCATCHGGSTHALTAPPTCASCHKAVVASAPKGHDDCAKCHESHAGKASKATCATCHAERAKGLHSSVKGSCTTCHRAHGPKGVDKAPACTTCHAAAKPPSLHVTHKECTKCHTSHAPADASRASCTKCHTDKKAHQPAAKVCNGCHVFRSPP